MAKIKAYKKEIPRISTKQMIEVDRLMMEDYHIELIQMMENAGRCLAIVAVQQFLKKKLKKKHVVVLAGTGGNGGGALVCARRLHNWGAKVSVFLSDDDDKMTPIPRHQLNILRRMGLDVFKGDALSDGIEADLVIDGVIGYSVKGDPYGMPKAMIDWANSQAAPVLSLDTPSGLDLTSGNVHVPTIKAAATLTLALPKQGLYGLEAITYRGDLYLGDISVPTELYMEPSLEIKVSKNLFAESDVIRIEKSQGN